MMTLEPPRSMVPAAAELSDGEVWRAVGLSRAGLGRFLRVAQAAVGLRGEVSVLLTGDRTLRRLNRKWRGKDKATDVLSFPAHVEMADVHAGDLAISLETAKRQGVAHGNDLRDEVRVLLLHGVLHLAGMDHEVDGGEMAGRETELRVKLRMKDGLIARVEGNIKAKALNAEGAKEKRKGRGEERPSTKSKRRFPSGMTNKKSVMNKKV